MFDRPTYPLQFVQCNRLKDESGNLPTFIYKFFSPRTRLIYIVRVECLRENLFALKFYCKKDRKSDRKYQKLTNRGDVSAILKTCLSVLPEMLQQFPESSFCFIASRSLDQYNHLREAMAANQRFRVYREFINQMVGEERFTHVVNEAVSGYLLLNNCNQQPENKIAEIKTWLAYTYPDLGDLT